MLLTVFWVCPVGPYMRGKSGSSHWRKLLMSIPGSSLFAEHGRGTPSMSYPIEPNDETGAPSWKYSKGPAGFPRERGKGGAPLFQGLGAPLTSPGPFQSVLIEAQLPEPKTVPPGMGGVPFGTKYQRILQVISESLKGRISVM